MLNVAFDVNSTNKQYFKFYFLIKAFFYSKTVGLINPIKTDKNPISIKSSCKISKIANKETKNEFLYIENKFK